MVQNDKGRIYLTVSTISVNIEGIKIAKTENKIKER